jgi:sulfur carrier protein
MKIRVNGNDIDFGKGKIIDLLEFYKINRDNVVVEKNSIIVHREKYISEAVSEGDVIEIVSFVGGG